jgi:hypothetical protein
VIIAVYLYRRTQKTTEKELDISKVKPQSAADIKDIGVQDSNLEKTQQAGLSEENSVANRAAETSSEEITASPLSVVKTKAETPLEAVPLTTDTAVTADNKTKTQAASAPETGSALAPIKGNWASDTFAQLVDTYAEHTEPEAQHKCLEEVIAHCYKLRKQTDYCAYGAKLSDNYLRLFKQLKSDTSFKTELKGGAFMQLSTLLNDVEDFDAAIKVCQQAIDYQLDDGTVTGYAGRLARVEKAKAKAQA